MKDLTIYRRPTSLFTREELTLWCQENGGHYAQDHELDKVFFVEQHERKMGFYTTLDREHNRRYDHLNSWLKHHKEEIEKYNRYERDKHKVGYRRFDLSTILDEPFDPRYDRKYNSDRFVIKDIYGEPGMIQFEYLIDGGMINI